MCAVTVVPSSTRNSSMIPAHGAGTCREVWQKMEWFMTFWWLHEKRQNSSVLAMEFCLFYINTSISTPFNGSMIERFYPFLAEFISGKMKLYLHFVSFPNMIHEIGIVPHVRREPILPAYSMPWLLMAWWHKVLWNQQPWSRPSYPKIFQFQYLKVTRVTSHMHRLRLGVTKSNPCEIPC